MANFKNYIRIPKDQLFEYPQSILQKAYDALQREVSTRGDLILQFYDDWNSLPPIKLATCCGEKVIPVSCFQQPGQVKLYFCTKCGQRWVPPSITDLEMIKVD